MLSISSADREAGGAAAGARAMEGAGYMHRGGIHAREGKGPYSCTLPILHSTHYPMATHGHPPTHPPTHL
jgi:hypothetical protein